MSSILSSALVRASGAIGGCGSSRMALFGSRNFFSSSHTIGLKVKLHCYERCCVAPTSQRFKITCSSRRNLVTACYQESPTELGKRKCIPCERKDLKPMSKEAANVLIEQVPGWNIVENEGKLQLTRSWKTKNFMKGLEFFQLVADVAEAEGHHPDLHLVGWNKLSIDIWTHAIGGLTENDFILAAKINGINDENIFKNLRH